MRNVLNSFRSFRKGTDPRDQIVELQQKLKKNHDAYKEAQGKIQPTRKAMSDGAGERGLKIEAVGHAMWAKDQEIKKKQQTGLVAPREKDPKLVAQMHEMQTQVEGWQLEPRSVHKEIRELKENFLDKNAKDANKLHSLLQKHVDKYDGPNKQQALAWLESINRKHPNITAVVEQEIKTRFPAYVEALIEGSKQILVNTAEPEKLSSQGSHETEDMSASDSEEHNAQTPPKKGGP